MKKLLILCVVALLAGCVVRHRGVDVDKYMPTPTPAPITHTPWVI